jgi:hypothetical protein
VGLEREGLEMEGLEGEIRDELIREIENLPPLTRRPLSCVRGILPPPPPFHFPMLGVARFPPLPVLGVGIPAWVT